MKGKSKVGDNVQMIPTITSLPIVLEVASKLEESPSSDIASMGTESEMVETFPGEMLKLSQLG